MKDLNKVMDGNNQSSLVWLDRCKRWHGVFQIDICSENVSTDSFQA